MTIETEDVVARLDAFDKDEWWDISRKLRPDWTAEQFDDHWAKFQADKRKRAMQ